MNTGYSCFILIFHGVFNILFHFDCSFGDLGCLLKESILTKHYVGFHSHETGGLFFIFTILVVPISHLPEIIIPRCIYFVCEHSEFISLLCFP